LAFIFFQSLKCIIPCESGYNKGTCTPIFIAALFTIAKLWKQPRCPTTDECIKKMWCLYIVKFYSATTKNEILPFSGKLMELEIILSEVSQAQKAKSHSSLSYADYRPKINVQYYEMSHTKDRPHMGRIGQGKEIKNLNVVPVLTVQK
jgi:hypothetical protein